MATTVPCPNCRQSTEWSEDNPYRPFCSRRCKLIDLGDWIEERRGIPGEGEASASEQDDEHTDIDPFD